MFAVSVSPVLHYIGKKDNKAKSYFSVRKSGLLWAQCSYNFVPPGITLQGGSIGRASDSRFNDTRFEPRQEHKEKFVSFSESNIIIIIITVLIWRPSWSSDHSRRTLTHVNFFTLTVTFEHRTDMVAD